MTYDEIRTAWNAQADEHNQWADLGEDEKIEWSASIAAAKERTARLAAQEEVVALKERIARAGVEQRRAVREAVLAEREACAKACEGMEAVKESRGAAKMMIPTAQVLEPVEQRQLDIGKAIERACQELPEGAEIQIYLERGAGTVHMTDWDGNEFDHFDEDHDDFACRINAATDGAIAAEQVAAHVKQGGAAS